jgi:hypothetical protein
MQWGSSGTPRKAESCSYRNKPSKEYDYSPRASGSERLAGSACLLCDLGQQR